MRPRGGRDPSTLVPAPAGLEAFRLEVGADRYVVFEWPADAFALDRYGLTAAEREVARLVVCGWTNAEIARRRRASPRTIANQVSNVFRKTRVGSRAELVARIARSR